MNASPMIFTKTEYIELNGPLPSFEFPLFRGGKSPTRRTPLKATQPAATGIGPPNAVNAVPDAITEFAGRCHGTDGTRFSE